MKISAIATLALVALVALGAVSSLTGPARADGKDFIAGAIIGGAIVNENKKKAAARSTRADSGISFETHEQNREVQIALNCFGYNFGTPDGAIGPKSRVAISEYQAFPGFPATGRLTENERTILVTAFHRAVASGPVIALTVSGRVFGLKAVQSAQRD